MTRRLSWAILFFVFCTSCVAVYGFDIAIHNDPLSYWNARFLWCCRYGPCNGSRAADSAFYFQQTYNVNQMESVYEWYRDMGVTHLLVIYPFESDFDWIRNDSTHIKLMNWYYPGFGTMHGAKYVDAQYRDVQVGLDHDADPTNPNAFWSYDSSIGGPAQRMPHTELGGPEPNERPVVAFDSCCADTMWRATSDLGSMTGWDFYNTGWLDSSIYMPMHFKITWAVDPNDTVSTSTEFADFFWIVKIPEDRIEGSERWWRYPIHSLKLDDVADTNNWNISEFTDSLNSGTYQLLNSDFEVVEPVESNLVHWGSPYDPGSLDDLGGSAVSFAWQTPVRMSVWYHGTHAFYLNRIEIYDEGAWRMFVRSDSSDWQDSIWYAFRDEYDYAGGKSAGWYHDEWDPWDEQMRSIVKVNKLLQTNGPPTHFMNDLHIYWGDSVYANGPPYESANEFEYLLAQENVEMSTYMNEMYLYGGDTGCTPDRAGSMPTEFLWTTFSSDTPYVEVSLADPCPESDQNVQGCGGAWQPYEGFQSLQCAIDGHFDPNETARILTDSLGIRTQKCPGDYPYVSIAEEAKFIHSHIGKFWALIHGGPDTVDWKYPFKLRAPTPNEVKLTAWLAVSYDVDGIMWYPWDFGGLIEWTGSAFDTTERYAGAQKVCNDIQRIAPVFESLDFVKSYASRAYERNYPDWGHQATCLDTLATNCTWYYDQNFRAVEEILTWKLSDGSWVEEPDSQSYVQVSRFRNPLIELNDPTVEDFWFLIVNRRALPNERRKVRLLMQIDTTYLSNPYYVDYMLGDSTISASPCAGDIPDCANREIDVILEPGEAELVHFYRGELGCDVTEVEIFNLTACHAGANQVRLRWESVIGADMYFICGSPRAQGQWTAFAFKPDTTYVDTMFSALPHYFYTVQACWNKGR